MPRARQHFCWFSGSFDSSGVHVSKNTLTFSDKLDASRRKTAKEKN